MNFKLYAALTAFLLMEVSSYTITLQKTSTVHSQIVVLLHALMLGMKVNQSSEKLFYYMMASSGLC